MLRTRILAAATATFLALGMAVGGASPAMAGNHTSESDGPVASITCNDLGYEKPDELDSIPDDDTDSYDAPFGTISWSGTAVTVVVEEGFTAEICIKGGNEAPLESGVLTAGTYNFDKGTLSHIGFRYAEVEILVDASTDSTPENCLDGAGTITFGGDEGVTFTVDGIMGTFEPGDVLTDLTAGDYEITAIAPEGSAINGDDTFTETVESTSIDCELPLVDASTDSTPENCLDGAGTITFVGDEGVTFTVDGIMGTFEPGDVLTDLTAGDYEITAIAPEGSAIDGDDTFTETVESTSIDCELPLVDASTDSTPENCLDGAGTITFVGDEGVTFTVDGIMGTFEPGDVLTDLTAGDYEITAIAPEGSAINGDDTFTETVESTSIECDIEVIPGADATPTNCVDGEGSIEFSDAEGVTYTVAGIDGTFAPGDRIENLDAGDYEITATADGGYVLDGDSEFTVEVEFEFIDCLPTEGTASVDLTYLPSSCISDGVVMVDPEGTSNVKSTTISRDGGVVTLVFVAADDSQFNAAEPVDLTGEGDAPSLEATFSEDLKTLTVLVTFDEFTEQECADTVVVPVPSVVDTCLEQSYTITAVEGASYAVSVNGSLPMPVSFEEGEDSVTISADPFDEIVVTATADEGYVLAEGYKPFEYTFEFDEECLPTAPVTTASVTWTQADCLGNPGSYTLTNEPGVIWTVDGVVVAGNAKYTAAVGSTPSIVASLAPASEEFPTGFGWSNADQRTLWNLAFTAAANCELTTLALTGASNALGGLGVIAILIMMAGTGLVVARRREAVRIQG